MRGRYSAEEKERIVHLLAGGMSVTEIRRIVGRCPVNKDVIWGWKAQAEDPRFQEKRGRLRNPVEIADAVARVVVLGEDAGEVARDIAAHWSTVRRWVDKYSPTGPFVPSDFEQVKRIIIESMMANSKKKKIRRKHGSSSTQGLNREAIKMAISDLMDAYADPNLPEGEDPDLAELARKREAKLHDTSPHDTIPGLTDRQLRPPLKADELPDDVDELKRMLIEEREHSVISDAAVRILGKGSCPLTPIKVKVLTCQMAVEEGYQTTKIRKKLGVSKASYYRIGDHLRPGTYEIYQDVGRRIRRIVGDHCRLGYRKVWKTLKRQGLTVSEKIVRAIMRQMGLNPPIKKEKRYNSYIGETAIVPPNLLMKDPDTGVFPDADILSSYYLEHEVKDRLTHDFHADAPNQKWVTDISEFKGSDGNKFYFSPIIDLFDRYVVAYAISDRPNMELVTTMLKHALAKLKPGEKPILHTDRGMHYRNHKWISALSKDNTDTWEGNSDNLRVELSMSRKGQSGDNAAMEGFFGTVKTELIYGRPLIEMLTAADLKEALVDYIQWYTDQRLSASLDYQTIAEFRENLQKHSEKIAA